MAVFEFLIQTNLILLPLFIVLGLTLACFFYGIIRAIAYNCFQKRIQIHFLDVASQYLSNTEMTTTQTIQSEKQDHPSMKISLD